ncbi:ABC transporter [Virgisporangium aliadipatigenens]|uniref:ABC transporter n=1 Tax=Virgisporangium aliadipatigenens TaxID=741659 RepID=A0A8J4DNI3_9ACTN|nr:ABC transporter ATP-binding protein [Virgisporangium aliadipatigenens]GIJ43603.1 ABC transporter [Virgisporangium aliadipatigenens]
MPDTDPAIRVERLHRTFGGGRRRRETVALDHIDLTIPAGEVHGLLGPNGAGKTTLCKILSTVLLPTGGTATVDGHDVVRETAAVRRSVGIVFGGERGLYTRLTARANLEFWAALYGLRGRGLSQRVDALLERFGLTDRAHERVEGFSRGMKQRLHLARGLVGDPRVVLLDEPTTGMDPVAAHDFRDLVRELRAEGRTVLLTTHDMAEAEAVCDRVSLVDGGRILATERPATLGTWISRYASVEARDVPPSTVDELRALPGVRAVHHVPPDRIRVETGAEDAAPAVLRLLVDAGVGDVSTALPSLADVYLHVIGDRGMRVNK